MSIDYSGPFAVRICSVQAGRSPSVNPQRARQFALLRVNLAARFNELVEQHRVHSLIPAIRIRAVGYGPNARSQGPDPTLTIVAETVSDGTSITDILVSWPPHTYSFVLSELSSIVQGRCTTGIVALTVCVAVSMAETVSENPFCTKTFVPSGVITSCWQSIPVGMVAITVNVVVSMTETVPSCWLVT